MKKVIMLIVFCYFFIFSLNPVLAKTMDNIYYEKPNDYTLFEQKIQNYPQYITMSSEDLSNLYFTYAYYNNPKCEFVSHYHFSSEKSNSNIVFENNNYLSDKQKIKKSLKILNKVKVSGTTIKKIKKIKKWLNKKIKYFRDESRGISAVCSGKGNCQAFSKCFKYLCNNNGINCETVQSDEHMWNIIKVKGKWYNIEPQGYYGKPILLSDSSIQKFEEKKYKRITKTKTKCYSNYLYPKSPKTVTYKLYKHKIKVNWTKGKNAKKYIFSWKYKHGKYKHIITKHKKYVFYPNTKKIIYAKVAAFDDDSNINPMKLRLKKNEVFKKFKCSYF